MRLIARLDVKNEHVIKGIHLEGLRKVGDPNRLAEDYYRQNIDEIVFMDAVASLYDRNNLFHIIERACESVFVPITIGGGLRSLADIEQALHAGADKIAVNTAAIRNPNFITEAARTYGSQCIVASIEAKRGPAGWEAYVDNGREKTGIDVLDWARQLEDLGCGEILITSVDQEGTKKGFDVELIAAANTTVGVPIIASGGLGALAHIDALVDKTEPSAIATASLLHYGIHSAAEIRGHMAGQGLGAGR